MITSKPGISKPPITDAQAAAQYRAMAAENRTWMALLRKAIEVQEREAAKLEARAKGGRRGPLRASGARL